MPMASTVVRVSPVAPFHAPDRTRSLKSSMRSSTPLTLATWSSPFASMGLEPLGARSATW